MTNELAIKSDDLVLAKREAWELMQRQAKANSVCTFVPDAFKNNVANCMLAMELADKMGLHWLTVMNSLHSIHGKFGWSAKFMIARINTSGKYASGIKYEEGGDGDDMFCRAWVWEKTSAAEKARKIVGTRVTIEMAKKEGWFGKTGSKWQTMPEQMLRYRAATFFCSSEAPELLMAVPMANELEDMKPAQAKVIPPNFSEVVGETPSSSVPSDAGGLGEIIDDE